MGKIGGPGGVPKSAPDAGPVWSHRRVSLLLTPRVRVGSLVLILVSYFVAVFWPLEWQIPRHQRNGVEIGLDGPAVFDRPGILRSYGSTEWLSRVVNGAPLHIHLGVVPGPPHPRFVGRLLAFTTGSFGRLLSIDRDHQALLVHLRGPGTDRDGDPPLRFERVFKDGQATTIDLGLVGSRLAVAVDGQMRLDRVLSFDPRVDWVTGYDVTLGSDLNVRKFFLGTITSAWIIAGDQKTDLLAGGQLARPSQMFYLSREPRLTVLEDLDVKDAGLNVVGFVPLGVIAAIWPGATIFSVLATGLAVSGTIEFTQLTVPGRVPSVDDILTNTLGVLVGWGLVFLLRMMLDRRSGRAAAPNR